MDFALDANNTSLLDKQLFFGVEDLNEALNVVTIVCQSGFCYTAKYHCPETGELIGIGLKHRLVIIGEHEGSRDVEYPKIVVGMNHMDVRAANYEPVEFRRVVPNPFGI